ncbi:MAG: SRPBCC domain-containing protein [Gemmatimonadetes bacterium]|nr:SRPBCC domain-containing protein [Gemmatimonadota bacterium]
MTVGYQRIKGLREQGQRRSGEYEASKSRTLPVSLTKLYRAFSQPRLQSQWLPDVTLAVRSATPNKYIHITWEDGTSVDAGFTSKARSKAQVAVQHRKLQSKEAANRMKQYWTERLDALAEMLAPGGNGKS